MEVTFMATTAVVKAVVDADLKGQAEKTLRALGLDMTSAVRMFLKQVVLRGGIPFDVTVPKLNDETLAAIADAYAGRVHKAKSVASLFEEDSD
jgi:DNA-damage-inducible protein J